jgi:uncharacterized protein with PIN domain
MRSDRDRIEEELLKQAQQAIRRRLEALPDRDQITLSEMERLTGEMGHEVMQHTLPKLSETQQSPADRVGLCEACNRRMHKRGKRKKRVVTVRGQVEIERQYYMCPGCGRGHFPPG